MATTTVRKLLRSRPARTPEEIAARIAGIARTLQRNVNAGRGVDAEEARLIAKKLALYAARLRAPADLSSAPADPVFPIIQGERTKG